MLLEQAPVEYEKHVKSWVGQVPLAVQLIKFISDKHNSLYLLTKGRHSMKKGFLPKLHPYESWRERRCTSWPRFLGGGGIREGGFRPP